MLQQRASRLFDEARYLESALTYAKTKCSFETTVLKFVDLPVKDAALLNYLKKKLEVTRDRMEMVLIVVWLVDVTLTQMSDLEQEHNVDDTLLVSMKEDFVALLKTPKIAQAVRENKASMYELMADHGQVGNMIRFADVTNEHERLVKYYLQINQFLPVLDILKGRPELVYEVGAALMRETPAPFVLLLIGEGRRLNPVRLVPCLAVSRTKAQELEAIRQVLQKQMRYCATS